MTNSLASLSVTQLRRAISVREQIEALEKELSQLLGAPATAAATPVVGRRRRKMSPAGRARIAAGQKARWAKIKPIAAPKPAKVVVPRRKMSAEGRARMAAAAKARWKKAKAAGKSSLAG